MVSPRDAERRAIAEVLSGSRYVMVPAASLDQAARLLSHVVFPILIYDCRFSAGDWKQRLERLIGAWCQPSILLLAESCAYGFWEEAICDGAFDVLTVPCDRADLLVVLDFAYTHWKLGLTIPLKVPAEFNS